MALALPLPIRVLNRVGTQLERAGALRNHLSVDSILKRAQRATGVSDWGDWDLSTPLESLTRPDTERLGSPS